MAKTKEFTTRIALHAIGRNRANPRSAVEDAAIAELAESLKTHGMLQPVVLRPAAPGLKPLRPLPKGAPAPLYELVAGERRALAAVQAGWNDVPAVVRDAMSDADALELSIVENEQREDLSAIDRARGYRRWLEETGRTQKELAAIVGRHHTTVSNTLALLDAPEGWQKRVNSGQIPPTFVRHVLPYVDAPKVLETLEKRLDEAAKQKQPIETVADWQFTVKEAVRAKSVPLVKGVHVSQPYAHAELRIDKTHPRYAELQVIDFDAGWRKEKRALNTQLANQILGEKAKAWKAKHGAKKDVEDKAGVGKAAAKLKAQQDREAHRRKLQNWLEDWQHFVCAQRIGSNQAACERLALLLLAHQEYDSWGQDDVLDALLHAAKIRRPTQKGVGRTPTRVWSVPEAELGAMGRALLAGLLWSKQRSREAGPIARLTRPDVELLCRELSIDLAAAWQQRVAGTQVFADVPLTQAYWDLHTAEQLAELAFGWGLVADASDPLTDEDLGRLIDGAGRALSLPDELAELIQPPPRKPRSKKKGGAGEGGKGRTKKATAGGK